MAEAIESALSQDWANHEVIVVDDGSTDATADVCREFGSSIVLLQQENRGVSAARNRGLAAARGVVVAFLDSDDLWLPGKLSAQMQQLSAEPSIVVSATRVRYDFPHPVPRNAPRSGASWEELFRRDAIWATPTIVVRASTLREVGGFREDIRHYEDRDLWLRLLLHGDYGVVEQELVLVRRVDGQGLSRSALGHEEWVSTSLDIIASAHVRLGADVVSRCRAHVFEQLPDMVWDAFWKGELGAARRLGVLQFVHGPRRLSAIKYLWLSFLPGVSWYLRRRSRPARA